MAHGPYLPGEPTPEVYQDEDGWSIKTGEVVVPVRKSGATPLLFPALDKSTAKQLLALIEKE